MFVASTSTCLFGVDLTREISSEMLFTNTNLGIESFTAYLDENL